MATALGIGDGADRSVSLKECIATVRRAIQAGLNVIDTAPAYEDGYGEQIVGLAVRDCRESMSTHPSNRRQPPLFLVDRPRARCAAAVI